jgi:hypothetical protein
MFEYGKSAYKNLQKVKIHVLIELPLLAHSPNQSPVNVYSNNFHCCFYLEIEPVQLPAELSKFLIVNGAVDNPKKDQVQRAPGPYPFVVSCSN